MGKILEEDPDMRDWFGADQFLVHVGIPSQLLYIAVTTNADKAFAAPVVGIPIPLHHAENPEHQTVHPHEPLARGAQRPCIAGFQELIDRFGALLFFGVYC